MARKENTIQENKNRFLKGIKNKKDAESKNQEELRNKYATIQYTEIKNKVAVNHNLLVIYRRYYTDSSDATIYSGTQYIERLEGNINDPKYKTLNNLLKSFNIPQFLENSGAFELSEYERGIFEHLANSCSIVINAVNEDLEKLCIRKKKFELVKKFEELSDALYGIDEKLNELETQKTINKKTISQSVDGVIDNKKISFCEKLRYTFGEDLEKSIKTNDLNELSNLYDRYDTISLIFRGINNGINGYYSYENKKEIENNLLAAKEILIEQGVCRGAIVEFFENLIKAIEKLLGYEVSCEFNLCKINELRKQIQIHNNQSVGAY